MRRRVIGLCGGIGSGKSSRMEHIRKYWAAEGATHFPKVAFATIDADKVGHQCYEPGTDCYKKVVSTFGDEILDTTVEAKPIDRKKLGAAVFGTGRMPELNQIVWPAIADAVEHDIARIEAQVRGEGKHALVYVLEAAILPLMAQMLLLCNEVWMFHVAEAAAVQRIVARNGFSPEEALKRVKSQSTESWPKLCVDSGFELKEGQSKPMDDSNASEKKLLAMYDTTNAVSDEQFLCSLEQVKVDFQRVVARLALEDVDEEEEKKNKSE